MITTALVFDRKKKASRNSEGAVEIRVTIDRKASYISTGVKVRKDEWMANSVVNRPDSDVLNGRIMALAQRLTDEINQRILSRQAVDIDDIKRHLLDGERDDDLLQWIEDNIPMLHVGEATKKRYMVLLGAMRDYGAMTRWTDVTVEAVARFDFWLHQKKKPQSMADKMAGKPEEPISDAGVYNYHKCLKALLYRAEKMGRIERSPYERMRGDIPRGDKENAEYLTAEEMAAFERLAPIPGTQMSVARDLFVFQMHTGLSYADTQAFDFSQYRKVDGHWTFIGPRVKTGVTYITQLSDECERILERYGWSLPHIGNSDYNSCLKALGMAAGISTPLHSHLARHTFGTYMLAHGSDISTVARMMGHNELRTTQRYAKVLPKTVFDDFNKIKR